MTRPSIVLALAMLGVPLASAAVQPSLYERMGGEPVVRSVVSDLIDEDASDPKLKRSFAKVDLKRLKKEVTEQICALAGGPCHYSGDSMRDAHAGLGITQAEFYGMVAALREDLRRHGVGLRERNELLALLAPMKRDVVER
jgi:hemoglobin